MTKSEKFWDMLSGNYEKQVNDGHIKLIEAVRKHLTSSDVVLDYACATGLYAHELADHVQEIHAIDISSKMIDIAIGIASERNIENINFAQSTLFDERYQTGSFDVILAFNILHLVEDPQTVLQRINALLKSGGVFISTTPCLGEKARLLSVFFSLLSKIRIMPYINKFKTSELADLIVYGNFQIVETEKSDDSPPSYYIVAKKTQPT